MVQTFGQGYENFELKLKKLGIKITRESDNEIIIEEKYKVGSELDLDTKVEAA